MDNSSAVVIAEIAAGDYEKLRPFFADAELDRDSWAEGDQKRDGMIALLQEAQVAREVTVRRQLVVSVMEATASFTDYSQYFARELKRQIEELPSAERADTLVLNLLPFHLSTTRVDKIIIDTLANESLGSNFAKIVILVRNIDWLIQSRPLRAVRSSPKSTFSLWVADVRGYVAMSVAGEPQLIVSTFPRSAFRQLLRTDQRTISQALIYRTNSYIGHFLLRDSHVRTHYDLTHYIQRDNVWEYMLDRLLSAVAESKSLLIIGVGLESGTISRAGVQLVAALESTVACDFLETYDIFSPDDIIPKDWAQSYETAIVLTDIVNTGTTVEPFLAELQRTANGRRVKVFSIAKMLNAPPTISGTPLLAGVEIKRLYYKPTECPLCDIRQPAVHVSKAADFRTVVPQQLTPFDFWEMIWETKALRRGDVYAQAQRLLYRTDTVEITRRYGGWLSNIIRQRYSERFPKSRPDAICTVAETPGKAFASLVARALAVPVVVPVSRRDLARTGPSGLPGDTQSPFDQRAKVLVVDDGINKGDTFRLLINFCRTADVEFLGGMVLDNRLDAAATGDLEGLMGGRPLFALYTWSSKGL